MAQIIKVSVLAAGLAAMLFMANISTAEPTFGGVSVSAGYGNYYSRAEIAWESPSLWTYKFSDGYGRLDLVAELGAAYWMAQGSRSPSRVWQFSATPFLRWSWNDRYYLEAGVGASVFSRTDFADKNLSTAFQFGDHIGVGAYLSDTSRVGLRYSHYSNAGIKRPNPGLNILQLMYTYRY